MQFTPFRAAQDARDRRDPFGSIVGVKTHSAVRLLGAPCSRPPLRLRSLAALRLSAQTGAHTVPDTIAQRMQACTPCHGREGRSSPVGYLPRIAGKPAGYLLNQLVNFRDGRRYGAAMSHLVESVVRRLPARDRELLRRARRALPAAARARPNAKACCAGARVLATRGDPDRQLPACTQCHGYALTGALPAIPGLLGLPADYVIGQLGAWKTDNRRAAAPDCMAHIAKRLSSDDVRAVAVWLASRPVPRGRAAGAQPDLPLPLDCGSGLR